MAKNTFKRSIAMLLVLNMLTGMLPIQALAEDGNTEAPAITVTVTPSESAPKAEKQESAPAEKTESAPAEKTESAPAEKTESAPAEKTESAPAEKTESAPAEKTESAEVESYDDNNSAKVEHDSNLTFGENVEVTVSKETVTGTDEEGNEVVTETTEVATEGTADNGDLVKGEETFVETTTTTETETIVESVLEGEQETESTEEIAVGEEVPEVVAPIIPDAEGVEEGSVTETVEGEDGTVTETTTTIEKVTDETTGKESVKVNVHVEETKTETVGDVQDGEDDTDFDFTEIETTIIRDVTTETTGSIVQTDDSTVDLEQIVAPEDYEGKHYDTHEKITGFTQPDGLLNGMNPDYKASTESPEEGYDYVISGNGDATWAAAPVVMQVVYQKDENGNPIPDGNGGYLIESSQLVYAGSKAGNSGMNSTPGQIVVKNEEGELFYTYCIDKATPTQSDKWYKVSNLEDSDYYANEESAAMLRAIVTNGYWGTDAYVYETDEDGNVLVDEEGKKIIKTDEDGNKMVDETVTGSLAKIKALMKSTYGDEDTVTVKDAKGVEHTYKVVDLIDGLMEHEALAATQGAIWSYSNSSLNAQNGIDGEMIVGVQSAKKFFNGKNQDSPLNQYAPAYNLESDARLKALYECLMGLEPVSQDDADVSTVINEKNFVEDMSLTVKDKVEDHEDNKDDNDDNDVYNTELNFTLAFVPDQKTDDLLVYLLDDKGNKINGEDGKPIVKRLVGENSEGREADTITADENGVYTLTGIQLSENSEFKFDLQLEGTHLLKDGVYIYTAHGGRNDSQTLVGMASGTQNVNVHASMSLKFEVDEGKTVVATRKWRETSEEVTPRETEETPPPPAEYRLGFGVGQLEVIEEEVPLAAPPQTGDMSILWFAMIVMSGCGLCILNLLEKRKCRA